MNARLRNLRSRGGDKIREDNYLLGIGVYIVFLLHSVCVRECYSLITLKEETVAALPGGAVAQSGSA